MQTDLLWIKNKTGTHAKRIISAASTLLLALIKLDEKGSFCKLVHQPVGQERLCSCAQRLNKRPISPRVCGCAAVRQPASHKTWNDPELFTESEKKWGFVFPDLEWNSLAFSFLGSLHTCGFSSEHWLTLRGLTLTCRQCDSLVFYWIDLIHFSSQPKPSIYHLWSYWNDGVPLNLQTSLILFIATRAALKWIFYFWK